MNRQLFEAKHLSTTTQASKLVWTKDGWERVPATRKDIQAWDASRTKSPINNDFNFKTRQPELVLIQDAHNEIMYGSIGSKLDELPQGLKLLLSDPDKWYLNKNNSKLYSVCDPISQVYEYGEWGADRSDADPEVLNENPSVSRLFLEAANIIPIEASTERVTDILGSIAYDKEGKDLNVYESPFALRMDVDISAIAIKEDSHLLGEECSTDDIEASLLQVDDDVIIQERQKAAALALPEIPEETKAKIRELHRTFTEMVSKAQNEQEYNILTLSYEQALDREVGTQLTTCLNSPYCGHGYSGPRRRHSIIKLPEVQDVTAAAEERVEFFHKLFGEAASCSSFMDLFGPAIIDPITGQRSNPGGFMGKIRGMYAHDKDLWITWSMNDFIDKKTGKIIYRSAFNLAREGFIREWREEEKGDEESLRIAVWVMFDREQTSIPGIRDNKGNIIQEPKFFKDSIWRQNRTKAMEDAYLTRPQWDAIYKMIDIVKKRIKAEHPDSKTRRDTLEKLAKHFTRITNLHDLKTYMAWAQKRTFLKKYTHDGWSKMIDGSVARNEKGEPIPKLRAIQSYEFSPSMIDRVTILDEARWRKSCAKKKRHLVAREILYNSLREQVVSSRETNIEASLPCTKQRCASPKEIQMMKENPSKQIDLIPAMAIGKLKWYEISNGKGLLGLECDQCGQIVWQLDHKETPKLKSFEEVTHGS